MINIAAPAVNPTTTECGTISTKRPARTRPNRNWIAPTMNVSVNTSDIYAGVPGIASGITRLMVISEIAFAGPVTINRLEPKIAAIKHGTIAE